VISEISW